jgi:hypothetical protein
MLSQKCVATGDGLLPPQRDLALGISGPALARCYLNDLQGSLFPACQPR